MGHLHDLISRSRRRQSSPIAHEIAPAGDGKGVPDDSEPQPCDPDSMHWKYRLGRYWHEGTDAPVNLKLFDETEVPGSGNAKDSPEKSKEKQHDDQNPSRRRPRAR